MFIKTPAWVICGLLDAGKTTLINRLLQEELKDEKVLVLQFEAGEETVQTGDQTEVFFISKHRLEQKGAGLVEEIREKTDETNADLLLIEWNGMAPFEEFENLFLQSSAKKFLSIEKIVYVADPKNLQARLRDGGTVTASQIAASDLALVRGKGRSRKPAAAAWLRRYHRNLPAYTEYRWEGFVARMFRFRLSPAMRLLIAGTVLLISMSLLTLLRDLGFPVIRFISVFSGVFLQAIPFLALGVLLSSAIQVYVSTDFIERRFPKSLLPGQLFAAIAGFFLPVCDCASIPVFRSLVKKGVPLPAAVTFMLASPVMNPVVLLSTWYAFGGNWKMVAARSGLGLLTAFCVGMTCLVQTEKTAVLLNNSEIDLAGSCAGRQPGFGVFTGQGEPRYLLFLSHARDEFFSVGKYLLTGIFVSTVFQNLLPATVGSENKSSGIAMLLFMMLLAFLLSLCSSSDAVVARTLGKNLPAGPILGFLVFGPMMDLKNIAMLLSGFQPRFVLRLLLTTFAASFLILLLFMSMGSGGISL